MRALSLVCVVGLWGCTWVGENELVSRMDLDADGIEGPVDCDDSDAEVREPRTWYRDADGDGFGSADRSRLACEMPDGFVDNNADCDDDRSDLNPADADSDGASTCEGDCDDMDFSRNLQDVDGDGVTTCDPVADCDDGDALVRPGALELPGDGRDQDCDGVEDCFVDGDEDGARDASLLTSTDDVLCSEAGLLLETAPVDCDDDEPAVRPGAAEWCNGRDDDCDGEVDNDPVDPLTWHEDADNDGSAAEQGSVDACVAPVGYLPPAAVYDCDDADPALNQQDEDGDGVTSCAGDCDDLNGVLHPLDLDQDGHSSCDGDCDDTDSATAPDATEWCNDLDDDCDEEIDEDALDQQIWYQDADLDGYGDPEASTTACEAPSGYVSSSIEVDCDDGLAVLNHADADGDGVTSCAGDCNDLDPLLNLKDLDLDGFSTCAGDCDDADPLIHPAAEESWYDGVDQDCDGANDYDSDGDGFVRLGHDGAANGLGIGDCDDSESSVYPGDPERCGDYTLIGDTRIYTDSDCDGAHYLPDTVSGLEDGVYRLDLEADLVGILNPSPQLAQAPGGEPEVVEYNEIGICSKLDGSSWDVSLDVAAFLELRTLRITGHGTPILDGGQDGFLFRAEDVDSGESLIVENVTMGGDSLDAYLVSVSSANPIPQMTLALLNVDFGEIGQRQVGSSLDLVMGDEATLVLNDVSLRDMKLTSGAWTILSWWECTVDTENLVIQDADFDQQAMYLKDVNARFGSLEANGIVANSDGSVALIDGGVVTFTPDEVIKDDELKPRDAPPPALGLVEEPPANPGLNDNFSGGSGGALYVMGGAVVDADIPVFAGNTAAVDGGALFVADEATTVRFSATALRDNTAVARGGAIFTEGVVDIDRGTLSTNDAIEGGAVFVGTDGTLRSSNATYSNNTADYGGGVYAHEDAWTTSHESDNFLANSAAVAGGALYVRRMASLSDVLYLSNTAPASGGSNLMMEGGTVFSTGSVFSNGMIEVDLTSYLRMEPAWVPGTPVVRVAVSGQPAVEFSPATGISYSCGLGLAFGCIENPE